MIIQQWMNKLITNFKPLKQMDICQRKTEVIKCYNSANWTK